MRDDGSLDWAIIEPSQGRREETMKHSVPVLVLAGLSLTLMAAGPASAASKHQRPPAKYTALNAERTTPTMPAESTAARTDFGGDGTEIAIRLQDGHHGDGNL
jgi:hypothetical protein